MTGKNPHEVICVHKPIVMIKDGKDFVHPSFGYMKESSGCSFRG